MIVRIVPITPVVSKYFETIRTTGAIGSFHMIVSIASKARDAGSSAMSLGQTIEFLCVFCKLKPHKWMILFVKRTSYFGTCFLSWFCGIEKLEEFPEDIVFLQKLDVTDFLYWFQITPIRAANICVLFFGFSAIRAEFILDYWKQSDDFWDSLRSSRSSRRLRAFPYDRFKYDHPDRPDRTQLFPSDRGRFSRPGRLRSSG